MSYLCVNTSQQFNRKTRRALDFPSKAPPNPLENMTKIATSVAPAEKIEAPMCVNIVRLQDYLLPPDEVVLFDWLLVKQCYVFHHKSFY